MKTNNFNAKTTVTYLFYLIDVGIYFILWYFYMWVMLIVMFVLFGYIGKFDLFVLVFVIMNVFVLIGMATIIVDFVGVMFFEMFLDDKYEDDGECFGLEMMLVNIENDDYLGVLFDFNDLCLKDVVGDFGLSYEKIFE